MIKGIKQGSGIFVGFFLTALFAFAVSGTIKTWTSGETLTAADINTTIQSLKTAIENATQHVDAYIAFNGAATTYQWRSLTGTDIKNTESPSTMNRAGTVKNAILIVSSNNVNAACIVTLRKNGADTAIQFSVPMSSTTTVTDPDTVTYVASDTLGWRANCAGASSGMINSETQFEF